MTTAILSFDYSGLNAGFAFAAVLGYLLLAGVMALIAALVWRRVSPASYHWPSILLRVSFVCSSLLFAISVIFALCVGLAGFFRGIVDVLSIGFWILSSGGLACLARRQKMQTKPNKAAHPTAGNVLL